MLTVYADAGNGAAAAAAASSGETLKLHLGSIVHHGSHLFDALGGVPAGRAGLVKGSMLGQLARVKQGA